MKHLILVPAILFFVSYFHIIQTEKIDDSIQLQRRNRFCKSLGGRCRRLKVPCKDGYKESPRGRPFCRSRKRRCCYPPEELKINNTEITEVLLNSSSSDTTFSFKHIETGKFLKLFNTKINYLSDHTIVPLLDSTNTEFTFSIDGGLWGYIKNPNYGYFKACIDCCAHKFLGICYSKYEEFIYLVKDSKDADLFKMDQYKNIIIHRSGKYVCSYDGKIPKEESYFALYKQGGNCVEPGFMVVSPTNTTKEELAYGNADVAGTWNLVFSVDNANADQTFQSEVTIGHSKSESSTTKDIFAWEVSLKAQYWFAEMSASVSLTKEVELSSTETWFTEIKTTHTIEVQKRESLAVWQMVFIAEQMDHKSVQFSNIFAHTNSSKIEPSDDSEVYYIEIK